MFAMQQHGDCPVLSAPTDHLAPFDCMGIGREGEGRRYTNL